MRSTSGRGARSIGGFGENALFVLLCRMLLLCMGLRRLMKLLVVRLLCWVLVMALLSIVEGLRVLITLALTLLLRGMARHSSHSFMYECAEVTSMGVGSQLMDQLMGLGLRPRLYLSNEIPRFVALLLECTITTAQGRPSTLTLLSVVAAFCM